MRFLTGARPINSRSSSLEDFGDAGGAVIVGEIDPPIGPGFRGGFGPGGDVALGRGKMLVHDATPGCDPSTDPGGF